MVARSRRARDGVALWLIAAPVDATRRCAGRGFAKVCRSRSIDRSVDRSIDRSVDRQPCRPSRPSSVDRHRCRFGRLWGSSPTTASLAIDPCAGRPFGARARARSVGRSVDCLVGLPRGRCRARRNSQTLPSHITHGRPALVCLALAPAKEHARFCCAHGPAGRRSIAERFARRTHIPSSSPRPRPRGAFAATSRHARCGPSESRAGRLDVSPA
jgi:hypothetical protein